MPEGTLIPELTQTSADAQRVIEVYEVDLDDDNTITTSSDRPTTLKEQAEYLAQDVCDQAVKMVNHANSGKVETGGSDEAPTITITLSAAKSMPDKPTVAPSKATAKASS